MSTKADLMSRIAAMGDAITTTLDDEHADRQYALEELDAVYQLAERIQEVAR